MGYSAACCCLVWLYKRLQITLLFIAVNDMMSLEPASVQLFSFKNDWREGVLTFGLLLELLTQDFDRCTFEHDVSHKTTDACSWCLFWNLSGCDTATHEHNRVTVYKKALCALSFSEMSRSSCGLVWIHISSILPSYMTSSLSWIKKNMLQTHRLSLIRGYHFVGESLRKHKHTLVVLTLTPHHVFIPPTGWAPVNRSFLLRAEWPQPVRAGNLHRKLTQSQRLESEITLWSLLTPAVW